jgi:hypothetical protein
MLPPLISLMNCSITLNYQLRFVAIEIEIRNIIAELMLPPKFESHQLPVSKKLPPQGLGARLLFAQLAGQVSQTGHVITASVMFGLVHRRSLLLNAYRVNR